MVTPDEERDQYLKDPRSVCKYGANCYQRNPLHHQKYKHPPKKRPLANDTKKFEDFFKKRKIDQKDAAQQSSNKKPPEIETVTASNSKNAGEASKNEDREQPVINEEKPKENANGVNENKNVVRTPKQFDKKAFIKEKFLVDMPEDFYSFWNFCKQLKSSDPLNALASAGLKLVGPYDVLADRFMDAAEKAPEDYLIHWRYFHDPPEFQTVIKGNDSTGFHIGYVRDDPSTLPIFLAGNHGKKDGMFKCMGENIFAAVRLHLEDLKASCDPFKKMSISKLMADLEVQANKLGLELSEKTPNIKARDNKILARTFNKIGLIVRYDKKTQVGYRHLCVSDKELRKLLDRVVNCSDQQRSKVMSEVQPVLTATSIATDECDFGTGIELGWDILAHGVSTLNGTIEQFLTTGYELLQRSAFAKIISAHMNNRRQGTDLSIL